MDKKDKPYRDNDRKNLKKSKAAGKVDAVKDDWRAILEKRSMKSMRYNNNSTTPLSVDSPVFIIAPTDTKENETKTEVPGVDFQLPWKSVLPPEIQELCLKAEFTPEFCQANLRIIYSVGLFLHEELFAKGAHFAHGQAPYCQPERVEAAMKLVQAPAKPIKKMFGSLKPVGEGGFGSVFVGKVKYVPKSGTENMSKKVKRVAIKKVSHNSIHEKRSNITEIAYLATLSHPNIVDFYYVLHVTEAESAKEKISSAFGATNDQLWIVLEFMQGGTLAEATRFSNWTQNSVAFVAWQILLGLEYLHDRNFGHRDLKSNNVMMSVTGQIKLIDFGLCTDFSNGKQTKLLGTSHWIPPEMISRQPHDMQVDIWSFAVCILELFIRGPPHRGQAFKCMVSSATVGLQDQIPLDDPRLGKTGQEFLKNCLVVDPTKRATAKELLKHRWITVNAREDNGGIIKILSQIFLAKALL